MNDDNDTRAPRPDREERPHRDRERSFRPSGDARFPHDDAPRPFRRDGDRRPRRDDDRRSRRTSPLDAVMDLDKDILKLLARRANLLERLRGHRDRLDPADEKTLRAAWEKNAGRMSRDARLTRQMFALVQAVEFLPRPVEGEERRPAFNLAPVQKPVDLRMTAPLACRRSRLYLTLAAVAGCACRISPSLLNDPAVECVKMLNQCGTSVAWDEDGTLRAREGGGLTLADKVVFVGDDSLNFHLLLGQYVGHPSRAKFTGESTLKLADFSALRRFLPRLGARLTNVVPKSDGLPVRLECSGILPDMVDVPADLPADAVTGLLLGAPFWERPVAFNLSEYPGIQDILAEAVPVLQDCGADVSVSDALIRVTPGTLRVPAEPALGMELTLAATLLALPGAADGQVRLAGRWPACAAAQQLQTLLEQAGVRTEYADGEIRAERTGQSAAAPLDAGALPERFAPLALACAALPALRQRESRMPLLPPSTDPAEVESFLRHVGLEADGAGQLRLVADGGRPEHAAGVQNAWTAPSAPWALALALTAYARPGLKLANPGVMTALYPGFWALYNALPCPDLKRNVTEPVHEKPVRRRIIAGSHPGTGSGDSDD